jgi:hypothetical protein
MEADAMEVDDMEVVNHQILSKLSVFATDEEEVSEQDAFGEDVYDIDAFDMDEPRYMSEYINIIYDVLRELERAPGAMLDPNFLSKQKDVSPRHRGMVVDWLMEVSMKCVLRSDTIFLAIQLLDRFMHVRLVPRAKLQLIGATALFVASKFEETYSLPAEELANLSDGDFKKAHLLDMERVMLHSLKWNLTVPTSLLFLRRWGKAAHSDMHQHTLCKFIVELALSEYSVVRYLPSVQAASAVYLSRRMAKIQPSWTVTLTHYTGLNEEEVLPCARELNKIVRTETTRDEPKAVVLKYRAPSFYKVATVPPLHDL